MGCSISTRSGLTKGCEAKFGREPRGLQPASLFLPAVHRAAVEGYGPGILARAVEHDFGHDRAVELREVGLHLGVHGLEEALLLLRVQRGEPVRLFEARLSMRVVIDGG